MQKPEGAIEYWNDLDTDIFNFWNVVKFHCDELTNLLADQSYCREAFEKSIFPCDDLIEAAARCFIRLRCSCNGRGKVYREITDKGEGETFKRKIEQLREISNRVRHVSFSNLDFRQILDGMDRAGVLIYADPCYDLSVRSSGKVYKHEMSQQDHVELCEQVVGMKKAKIILSGYPCEVYRHYLSRWNRITWPRSVAAGWTKGSRVARDETVWMNF